MWTWKRILSVVTLTVMVMLGIPLAVGMFADLDAGQIMVVQAPISGDLTVYTNPGWKWQGWGTVTKYPYREQFSFSAAGDQGKAGTDESITTRFNDGGHGNISGVVNWQMPLAPDKVIRLHKDFRSSHAIEQMLIRPAIQKVIYNVGPTMSSTESAAEKRPEIPKYIDDQLVNGPYLTKTVLMTVKDPITGQDKQANIVTIAMDEKGKPAREAASMITDYGIGLQAVTINNIKYDEVVEKQIKERQNATTQVQISIANAKKAEQDAITTAKQGEANAAKAKWEQEVINAKEIAEADKRVRVADADLKAAELFKKSETLKGEGEAARKRLVMEADGQLDKRLDAVVKINQMYADAIKSAAPGAWAPQVVMGGTASGQGNAGNNASALVDLLTARTAKEVGVDLSVRAGAGGVVKK